jgi:hypothetical protein
MEIPAKTRARVVPLPVRARVHRRLDFSIVIEWENARLSELARSHRMLESLALQIAALDGRFFALCQIVFLYDRDSAQRPLIEQAVARRLAAVLAPGQLRLVDTEGLDYYQLKNFGARQCEGDVVVLLDSDVVPEADWLVKLIAPFRNPRAAVIAGTSYIELVGIYSKAVALWWLFPLRSEASGLRRVRRFWANNVAFRRSLFLASGFPDTANFRGQCLLLAGRLKRQGIPLVERSDARVSHPAPNGWRHFVCRGLCQGHDDVMLMDLVHTPEAATWRASWARYMAKLAAAYSRIRVQRARVGVGALGAAIAMLLAVAYFGLMFAGERIALRRPAVLRKYFPI